MYPPLHFLTTGAWNFWLSPSLSLLLAGMGSISGAVIGGLCLGIAQTVSSHGAIEAMIPGLNKVIIYLVAVIILLTMPRGLLGRRGVMEE